MYPLAATLSLCFHCIPYQRSLPASPQSLSCCWWRCLPAPEPVLLLMVLPACSWQDLTEDTFPEGDGDGWIWLIEFYAPWW